MVAQSVNIVQHVSNGKLRNLDISGLYMIHVHKPLIADSEGGLQGLRPALHWSEILSKRSFLPFMDRMMDKSSPEILQPLPSFKKV